MDSNTKQLISRLNDRLLNQTVIIQTLCNILVDKEVISQDELETKINESINEVNEQLEELETTFEFDYEQDEVEFEFNNYYGPIGEA
jgi:predicted transcriptional regulator